MLRLVDNTFALKKRVFLYLCKKNALYVKKSIDAGKNICIYVNHRLSLVPVRAGWQNGLCRGLQILLYRFDSGTGLQIIPT